MNKVKNLQEIKNNQQSKYNELISTLPVITKAQTLIKKLSNYINKKEYKLVHKNGKSREDLV